MNVYIDGFNLYYGSLRGSKYKWLDIDAVARRLFPKEEVHRIRYFTARVIPSAADPQQNARQETYLRALRTLPKVSIHFGFFQRNNVWMTLTNPPQTGPSSVQVVKTEEKGSDVNIASYLLMDAWQKDMEAGAIITNDSDLLTPVRIAEHVLNCPVTIVNPHPASRKSLALQSRGGAKQLFGSVLGKCQFPAEIRDEKGTFRRPGAW
ncbi:MAG: NYN domain-containing protein [Actinomycetota bacterium]